MNPIKKVRISFILIAEISVVVFLSTILLSANLITRTNVDRNADDRISYIETREEEPAPQGGEWWFPIFSGEVPSDVPSGDPPENPPSQESGQGWGDPFGSGGGYWNPWDPSNGGWGFWPTNTTPDQLAGTRYFTVTKKWNGEYTANVANVTAYDEAAAIAIAKEIFASDSQKGYYKNLRYNTFKIEEGYRIVFLDWTEQLEPLNNFTQTSIIIVSAGAAADLIILFFISSLVVRPMKIADEKQKRFISNASHELKTPLTIISANNEIIEMEHGEEETTRTISRQVTKMTDMVRSMTLLSKLGETEKKDFVKFDLSGVVLQLADEFKAAFAKAEKKLTTSVSQGITLKGDEGSIRRLISIFLDNARKYALTHCLISLYEDHGIVLRVSNDTNEKERGDQSKVFDRFYRSNDARGSKKEGSGIGLSIAKEIIDLHKGKPDCYINENGDFIIEVRF